MAANSTPTIDPTKSKPDQLKELLASASHHYARKSYGTASDLYAQAAELQDEINGEMSPDNAELLYAYGRCLHHLAVSKSDVLGGKVAGPTDGSGGAKSTGKKRKRNGDVGEGSGSAAGDYVVTEKVLETVVEEKDGSVVKEQEQQTKSDSKPFFQINGDDDEWQSEEDGEGGEDMDEDAADAEAEEEEDDFAIAYEILDTARILLTRQIEALRQQQGKGKAIEEDTIDETSKQLRTVKERLADTHDLQAEISLENERFTDAISDSRLSLGLKKELYDESDGLVSEAHYKLSLALEFASVTTPKDESGNPKEGAPQEVDQKLRDEAAHEMEAAIKSTKLKLDKETKAMDGLSGERLRKKQVEKKEFEEIITDMEQRLEDLKNPPVSANTAFGPAGAALDNNPLGGILGEMLGESPQALKARIEEASKGANDLSGLVKHKKKAETGSPGPSSNGDSKEKRKAEADDAGEAAGSVVKRQKTPAN